MRRCGVDYDVVTNARGHVTARGAMRFRMSDVDPRKAITDADAQRVLRLFALGESFPSTPLFRSVLETEVKWIEGLRIAADEVNAMRLAVRLERAYG